MSSPYPDSFMPQMCRLETEGLQTADWQTLGHVKWEVEKYRKEGGVCMNSCLPTLALRYGRNIEAAAAAAEEWFRKVPSPPALPPHRAERERKAAERKARRDAKDDD